MITRRALLASLPFLLAPAQAGKMARYNFVIYGQSNASGRGTGAPPVYEHNARIFNYKNNGQWAVASEPIDDATGTTGGTDVSWDGPAAGNGLGMAFANRLCELHPEVEIGLIPCARGGTLLKAFRPYPTKGTLYGNMCKRVEEASALGTISGVIFWQGEADAGDFNKLLALQWPETFGGIVARSRIDLGNLNLPWAVVRLNNLSPAGKWQWNFVRERQTDIHIRRVAVVSSDGVGYQQDKVHCTTAGYVTMGTRIADAIDPLVVW